MIQHPNPLKQIIDDIKSRLDHIEAEIKSIKWISSESLKIVEQNELCIKSLAHDLEELSNMRLKCSTACLTDLKPERKVIRKCSRTSE